MLIISGAGTEDDCDSTMGAVAAVVADADTDGAGMGVGVAAGATSGLTSSMYVAGNRPSSPFVFRPYKLVSFDMHVITE